MHDTGLHRADGDGPAGGYTSGVTLTPTPQEVAQALGGSRPPPQEVAQALGGSRPPRESAAVQHSAAVAKRKVLSDYIYT